MRVLCELFAACFVKLHKDLNEESLLKENRDMAALLLLIFKQ